MKQNLEELNELVREHAAWVDLLRREIGKVIIGQTYLIDRLLVGLLANGHVLLEGVPGLAKTLSIRTLAQTISADFKRIQFTPDLLPADIVGTMIYNPKSAEFITKRGPIFANLVLADEINRAPAKVQSALLEAMQEHCVTLGDETHMLPEPFLVMATQTCLAPLFRACAHRDAVLLQFGFSRGQRRRIFHFQSQHMVGRVAFHVTNVMVPVIATDVCALALPAHQLQPHDFGCESDSRLQVGGAEACVSYVHELDHGPYDNQPLGMFNKNRPACKEVTLD